MAVGEVPLWVRKYFRRWVTEEELKSVDQMVTDLEKKTSGEVVVVICSHSVPIGQVVISCFLALCLVGFFLTPFFVGEFYIFQESPLSWLPEEIWFYLLSVLLSLVLSFGISSFNRVRRFFIPDADEIKSCQERAELEFFRERVHQTSTHSGVLVFLSLLERRVVILADKGISEKVPTDFWQKSVFILTENIKAQKLGEGLKLCLAEMLQSMIVHFPENRTQAPNELCNFIRFKT